MDTFLGCWYTFSKKIQIPSFNFKYLCTSWIQLVNLNTIVSLVGHLPRPLVLFHRQEKCKRSNLWRNFPFINRQGYSVTRWYLGNGYPFCRLASFKIFTWIWTAKPARLAAFWESWTTSNWLAWKLCSSVNTYMIDDLVK